MGEPTGKAIEDAGHLWHFEDADLVALCGKRCDVYPLRAELRLGIWCGPCLIAAGARPVVPSDPDARLWQALRIRD